MLRILKMTVNNQEQIPHSHITEEIMRMYEEDQQMREKNLSNDEYWDKAVDKRNTNQLKEIIGEVGWPTVSKVGPEAMRASWLLVQHADHDTEFQKKCLELMKQQEEGEVDKANIAYLEDRVRINEGRPQLYGTQFHDDENGNYGPRPIEDFERVDERRREMGMDTLEEYRKRLQEKYKSPKPSQE